MSDEWKRAPQPSQLELETERLEAERMRNANLHLQLKAQQRQLDQQKAKDEFGDLFNAAERMPKMLEALEGTQKRQLDELAAGPHQFLCHLEGQLPAGRSLHEPWLLVGAEHQWEAVEKYKDYMNIIDIGPPDNGDKTPEVQVVPVNR